MDLETSLMDVLDPCRILQKAGIHPDEWQSAVLRSGHARILMNCSRQSGKSLVAAALALHCALFVPRSLVLLISPSQRQSQELFRQHVLNLLRTQDQVIPVEAESLLRLELTNGSRILSLPGENPDTIRGYSSVNLIVLDEAARISDEVYAAVRPVIAVSQGKMVALSTPAGRRGWFFNEWHGENDWMKVSVPATECPRIPTEFLEEERRSMGETRFAAEYCCEFTDIDEVEIFGDALLAGTLVDLPPLEL